MARIRSIKPKFFRSHALYALEVGTNKGRDVSNYLNVRVAFAGLWTAADKRGRFDWVPYELKLDCLPYDAVDFNEVLAALAAGEKPFIVRYEAKGKSFGFIPGFSEHQRPHHTEAESVIPPYKDENRVESWLDTDSSPLFTGENLLGRERKGKERKGKEIAAAPKTAPAARGPDKPRTFTPDQKIMRAFKEAKGVDADDTAWDKLHYKRFARAAADIRKVFEARVEEALVYILAKGAEYDDKKLDGWGLEAIARAAATDLRAQPQGDDNGPENGAVDAVGVDGPRRPARLASSRDLAGDALAGLRKQAAIPSQGARDVAGPSGDSFDDEPPFA